MNTCIYYSHNHLSTCCLNTLLGLLHFAISIMLIKLNMIMYSSLAATIDEALCTTAKLHHVSHTMNQSSGCIYGLRCRYLQLVVPVRKLYVHTMSSHLCSL